MSDRGHRLQDAAAEFIEYHKDDVSYREVNFKLKQAMSELDLLIATPGRRAAMAAGQPNGTGQDVHDGAQEPSLQGQ